MQIDFSGLFHRSSKDITAGGTHVIPPDPREWPDEWKTTHYKKYNLDTIALIDYSTEADLLETIRTRRSGRSYSRKPLDRDSLSMLLKYSCGIVREDEHARTRAQPSGGARFPIEIYPFIFSGSEEIPSGIYHYDVKEHMLDVLSQRLFSPDDVAALMRYGFAKDASCAIIMTAVFARTQVKYRERGYRFVLLEAGHIGQNLYLVSNALNLSCCAMGGTNDMEIEKMLEIDGVTESVVYGLLIG